MESLFLRISIHRSYQEKRKADYPDIGDQLDAVFKLAEFLQESGYVLPAEVQHWISACRAVKNRHPVDEQAN